MYPKNDSSTYYSSPIIIFNFFVIIKNDLILFKRFTAKLCLKIYFFIFFYFLKAANKIYYHKNFMYIKK